jgi:hypothetical protein
MEEVMNPKLIPCLQKIFWIIGWAALTLAVFGIAIEVYQYFSPHEDPTLHINLSKYDFNFLRSLKVLFSSIGQAFFAFLVSAVLGMIFHRAPVRTQQTERFLILTCIGFVGEGIIGVISWVQLLYELFSHTSFSGIIGWLSMGTYLLNFVQSLSSFLYAATIYILYKHFSRMVTFESEVI